MLRKLRIKNFKILKDECLKLKPLSVFMGQNSMGKSSCIQALLLLLQNEESTKGRTNKRFALNGPLVSLGRVKDVRYQYADKDDIEIELAGKSFAESLLFTGESDYDYLETQSLKDEALFSKITGESFHYLQAERLGPRDLYENSYDKVLNQKSLGNKGEYTPHFLNAFGSQLVEHEFMRHPKARSGILLHQVDAWLGEISPGTQLALKEFSEADKTLLDFRFAGPSGSTNPFHARNVGFGLAYILPVITALLSFQKNGMIIIENPEAHLHPKAQSQMGLMVALAAKSGAQILLETHSDHVVNGIRVAARKEKIDYNAVGLFHFEQQTHEHETFSKVIPIEIDRRGTLSNYPDFFLDEWDKQLMELL